MEEAIYKIIYLGLWLAMLILRLPYLKKYIQQSAEEERSKVTKKRREGILLIPMMFLPFLWIFGDLTISFRLNFPDWFRLLGLGILVLSLFLFYAVHKTLGENWSPVLDLHKSHKLITTGPYSRVRHPMYTQIWMWVIGSAFLISNWLIGSIMAVSWALIYFPRVSDEEKMMEDHFGEEYKAYKQRTGRIIPKLRIRP